MPVCASGAGRTGGRSAIGLLADRRPCKLECHDGFAGEKGAIARFHGEGANHPAGQMIDPNRKKHVLRRIYFFVALIVLATAWSWQTMIHMPGHSFHGELPPADTALTALAADLHAGVAHLAGEIGERNVRNRPQALGQAADWITAQFRAAGYEVGRQTYPVSGQLCRNLDAENRGTAHPQELVIVGAHYDTVAGTAGANDNSSGVAAVLALARRFHSRKTQRTLRFVAFVNEEPPYFQTNQMGSRIYARQCRDRHEHVVAMLSLETIGYYRDEPGSQNYPTPFWLLYPSTGNFIGFIGNFSSRELVRRLIESFRRHESFPSEGAALPEPFPGVGFSDQWSFWQEGYPAVMVTDTAMYRYPYYHLPQDTIEQIDFDRMARVVRGLEKAIAELAGVF